MKKFKYFGTEYSVEDKYNYIAIDEDTGVWVYVAKPFISEDGWNSSNARRIDNNVAIEWSTSLRKIDDLVELGNKSVSCGLTLGESEIAFLKGFVAGMHRKD